MRPTSLAESWVKLADKIAVTAGAAQFRATVEPTQLGAGYPEGVVAAVWRMRRWACAIEEAAAWCVGSGELQVSQQYVEAATPAECVFVGADIKNAFGSTHRSGAIRAVARCCPSLAGLLAASWCNGARLWARSGPRQPSLRRGRSWSTHLRLQGTR